MSVPEFEALDKLCQIVADLSDEFQLVSSHGGRRHPLRGRISIDAKDAVDFTLKGGLQ